MDYETLNSLLSRLSGNMLEPFGMGNMGGLLTFMMRQYVPGMHGKDILWDSPLISQQTNMGTYMGAQQNAMSKYMQDSINSMQTAGRDQFMTDFMQSLVTRENFEKLDPKQRAGLSYEQYINHKAQGMSDNFFMQQLYNMIDPRGNVALAKGMGSTYQNIVRNSDAGILGDRGSFGAANHILNKMFRDEQGRFVVKSADYGNFDKSSIAQLTGELTKSTDILEGIDTNSIRDLDATTKKLSDKTKEYAKALSPLKDVFGNDMKKIVEAVTAASGMDIADMSSSRVSNIAQSMSNAQLLGKFTIKDIVGNTSLMKSQMESMRVQPMNMLFAQDQALDALKMSRGNYRNNRVSREYSDKVITEKVADSQNSEAADFMASTYAIWKEKQMARGNKNATYNDFRNAVEGTGKDMTSGAMQVAGINNKYQAAMGKGSSHYYEAVQNRWAAEHVMEASINVDLDRMTTHSMAMGNLRDAVMMDARTKGARGLRLSNAENNNGYWKESAKGITQLLKARPDLLEMDKAQIEKTLEDIKQNKDGKISYTENGKQKTLDINTILKGNTSAQATGLEFMRNTYSKEMSLIAGQANREKIRKQEAEMNDMRNTLNKAETFHDGSLKDLITNTLFGKEGEVRENFKGFNWDAIEQRRAKAGLLMTDQTSAGARRAVALNTMLDDARMMSIENKIGEKGLADYEDRENKKVIAEVMARDKVKDQKKLTQKQWAEIRETTNQRVEAYKKQVPAAEEMRYKQIKDFVMLNPKAMESPYVRNLLDDATRTLANNRITIDEQSDEARKIRKEEFDKLKEDPKWETMSKEEKKKAGRAANRRVRERLFAAQKPKLAARQAAAMQLTDRLSAIQGVGMDKLEEYAKESFNKDNMETLSKEEMEALDTKDAAKSSDPEVRANYQRARQKSLRNKLRRGQALDKSERAFLQQTGAKYVDSKGRVTEEGKRAMAVDALAAIEREGGNKVNATVQARINSQIKTAAGKGEKGTDKVQALMDAFYKQQGSETATAADLASFAGKNKTIKGKDGKDIAIDQATINKATAMFNTASRGTQAAGANNPTDVLGSVNKILTDAGELVTITSEIRKAVCKDTPPPPNDDKTVPKPKHR